MVKVNSAFQAPKHTHRNQYNSAHQKVLNFTGSPAGASSLSDEQRAALLQLLASSNQSQVQAPQVQVVAVPVPVDGGSRPVTFTFRLLDFVATVGLGTLILGMLTKVGRKALHKAGLWSERESSFQLPDKWKEIKFAELPSKLREQFSTAFKGIADKYKEGLNSSPEDLTLGHFTQALGNLLEVDPAEAAKLMGQLSAKTGNSFDVLWERVVGEKSSEEPQIHLLSWTEKTQIDLAVDSLTSSLVDISDADKKAALIMALRNLTLPPAVASQRKSVDLTDALRPFALKGSAEDLSPLICHLNDSSNSSHFPVVESAAKALKEYLEGLSKDYTGPCQIDITE